jgi:hypothetical protein
MTLRSEPCFRELGEAVRSFAEGRRIVEIVNTGNWGDALIHAGQAQFFRDNGIEPWRFSIFHLRGMPRPKLFVLSKILARRAVVTGNGAFREFYSRPKDISEVARNFSRVFIMPSSFPLMPNFDLSKTELWRRDCSESLSLVPQAKFCHDMAFYLNPSPRHPTKETGLFFRTDVEQDDFEIPQGNCDLSAKGTHSSDYQAFLNRVGEYEVIYTNRLHVGIAGALLNREVHLFGSRTNKVRSIFDSSLKPFYSNIHYHAEPPKFS